jgi:hypothetical protein
MYNKEIMEQEMDLDELKTFLDQTENIFSSGNSF